LIVLYYSKGSIFVKNNRCPDVGGFKTMAGRLLGKPQKELEKIEFFCDILPRLTVPGQEENIKN